MMMVLSELKAERRGWIWGGASVRQSRGLGGGICV